MKVFKILPPLICSAICTAALALSAQAIDFDAEKAMESVFVVHDDDVTGSGFALGENVIITNAHVATDLTEIKLTAYDGNEYDAFLIGYDKDRDVAVLGTEELTLEPLPTADYLEMPIGSDVYAIGAPKGMYFSLSKGAVSARERSVEGYPFIQSDAVSYGGNSGGPLFDSSGNVIGVNTLNAPGADGLTFSIPIRDVISLMQKLGLEVNEKGNVVGRVDRSMETEYDKPNRNGSAPSDTAVDFSHRLTAEDIAITALVIGCLSILLNVILVLMLRRVDRRVKLNALQNSVRAEKTDDSPKQ